MAVESKRGCGYRKVGGLYLVSGQLTSPCGRLPLELHVCPTCKGGIKQSRGWTWVNAAALLKDTQACSRAPSALSVGSEYCTTCPASPVNLAKLGEKTGLIWIGEGFYPTADDFMREASKLGVSRRISAVPRGFKLGEHWVLIAHPKAVTRTITWGEASDDEQATHRAQLEAGGWTDRYVPDHQPIQVTRKGIITLFKPTAIEKIVTESQAADDAEMDALAEKGITPVVVPDDDKDHQGSVHDRDDEPVAALPPMNGQLFARQAE